MSQQLQGWSKAGIHSINHFGLALPDLDVAEKFLTEYGLRVERQSDHLQVRASASEHVWVRIMEGAKHFEYLSLGCYAEDFDQICEQIKAAGGKPAEPHRLGSPDGIWFTDPDDRLVQVRVATKMMPDSKTQLADGSVPPGVQGAPARSNMQRVYPTRLAHMLLFTPNVDRIVDFYHRSVGIKVADRSRDIVAFTYARHGCDHHLIAFLKSKGAGIQHSSWDLPAIEHLGWGAERMRNLGHDHQWGFGRHVLGSNYFTYVQDPFGKWWEYNCHIDYIPAGQHWDGGDYEPENSLYLWGPKLPSDFTLNNEA